MPALPLPVAAVVAAPIVAPSASMVINGGSCKPGGVVQTRSTTSPGVQRLGDLPDGQLTRAVIVQAGPCPLRIVRMPFGFEGGTWHYEVDASATAWRTMPAGDR